jgi:hypothetical protein
MISQESLQQPLSGSEKYMSNLFIYLSTVLSLIIFIYLIPGIALFPRFILAPRTASTIPFISISMVVGGQYLLRTLNQFTHQNVILLISIFFIIALYRLFLMYQVHARLESAWTKNDFKVLLLIICSAIPLMIILGFDGFQHADEIMSWNLWAKKIYLNEAKISTGSPYPLLLPSFIAFCYKFIGNIDYQLPLRFTFIIIYISTIFSVFSFSNTNLKTGIFFITYIILFLIIGVGYEYKKVWADTLMSGFFVTALVLLISLSNNQKHLQKIISPSSLFLASIVLICCATLTKQGAIIWTLLIYPLLAYVLISNNHKLKGSFKLALLAPILTPVVWYRVGGSNFHTNTGVLNRSMGGRDYFEQFLFGFNESFLLEGRIVLLLFMIFVFTILLKRVNLEKAILAFGIVLSTIFLIFFGAYETTRLYLHIILTGWLILFAYGDHIINNNIGRIVSKVGNSVYTIAFIAILFIYWSYNSLNFRVHITDSVENFLDGRQVQLNWVTGSSGPEQYRNILDSKLGLWAKDSHIWGIYYGISNFRRGEIGQKNPDIQFIINNLDKENIGWVYVNKDKDIDEILKINNLCNNSLTEVNTSQNMYKQVLYKIDIDIISSCSRLNN